MTKMPLTFYRGNFFQNFFEVNESISWAVNFSSIFKPFVPGRWFQEIELRKQSIYSLEFVVLLFFLQFFRIFQYNLLFVIRSELFQHVSFHFFEESNIFWFKKLSIHNLK